MNRDLGAQLGRSNLIALAQLDVSSEQVAHLQQLNHQLHALTGMQRQQLALQQAQMLEQQRQAALQEALFESEKFARSASHLALTDPFAAAVRAKIRRALLQRSGVETKVFQTIEHKRALEQVERQLDELWHNGAPPPRLALAEAFISVVEAYEQWRTLLAGATDDTALELESSAAKMLKDAEDARRLARTLLIVGLVVGAAFVAGVIAGLAGGLHDADGLMLAMMFSIVVGAFIVLMNEQSKAARSGDRLRAQGAETLAKAETLRAHLVGCRQFLASEQGGQLLERVLRDHPALVGE